MKLALSLVAASAVNARMVSETEVQANPIRKVVTLLQDMQKELEEEGDKEKELYNKFMCFCSGNTENLSKEGEEAAAKIEELNAQIKAQEAEKAQLTQQLKQHKRDRASAKQDLQTATKLREKEHKTYLAAAGETKENIDAINAAIPALEQGMGSFLQTPGADKLKKIIQAFGDQSEPEDREAVLAFLSQSKDYAPASGQIVGILKNMKDEMDKSLGGIVGEEEAAVKGYEEIKAAKTKEIQAASAAIESKTKRTGLLAVSIVEAKNAQEDATAELGDSQKFMAELSVTCKTKTKDWEERSKIRSDEVAAISEAIVVLNNDDALDTFKSAVRPKVPSTINLGFLQTKNSKVKHHRMQKLAKKVQDLVSSASQMYKSSPTLNLLANTLVSKMRMGKVDFSVVVKMIDDMVALLKKEQKDDEKHRDWCGMEFDSSEDEHKDIERKLAALEDTISELKDSIEVAHQTADDTKAKITDLDKSVAEATAQRKAEHREFAESEQLNEAARQLIFKAKNRLNKFYNKALYVEKKRARELTREEQIVVNNGGEDPRDSEENGGYLEPTNADGGFAFVQISEFSNADVAPPVPPETYGAYKGKDKKGNSVVALMDMLTKELETDLQEAQHNEKTAQKEYAELLMDAQESRATDVKTVTTAEKSAAALESQLDESKTKQIMDGDALEQVKSYIADLHQSCDFIVANYDLRAQARDNEVSSLTNAKAVLNGASYN